jgi:ABC-type antimicrobial peptide transport system permease subunit
VVENVHTQGVATEAPKVVFLPFITANFWGGESFCVRELRLVIRSQRASPLSLLPEVRQAVWSVNRNLALADVRTLDHIFAESIARTSFTLVAVGIAGAVALILGLVGVYGIISYIVSQRRQEMGIRLAMGASKSQVTRMVLRQGGIFALLGVSFGTAVAIGLTRLMSALLFGVSPTDPATYATVGAALVGVVLLASYLPARRAARVDPLLALRAE